MSGKQIRLFLADGTAGGLITAEIMNWTGHVVAAPRSQLSDLVARSELARTGVYFLLGDDPDAPGNDRVYIGEADVVRKRLSQHNQDPAKEFWVRTLVLTSKDLNLTKAHVRYLESRFVAIAHQAARSHVVNATSPTESPLPEADLSDMEFFIAQARIILPVLGVNVLRSAEQSSSATTSPADNPSPVFVLKQTKDMIDARAQVLDGEFTVLAGSRARGAWVSAQNGYWNLRQQMEADGRLVRGADDALRFTSNTVFRSPSAAAAVVLGTSTANGLERWTHAGTGQPYRTWQNTGVQQAEPDDE